MTNKTKTEQSFSTASNVLLNAFLNIKAKPKKPTREEVMNAINDIKH